MPLRDYQDRGVQSVFDYYESGKQGNVVIAMPTGTGKSYVIAGLVQRVLRMWANQRFMVLTHVKELINQNHEKLLNTWQQAPTGIYSAGLNQKDIMQPIIFGGVQSVVNVVEAFGHRDLIIIDECHLVSPKDNTMYQNVLARLKVINPHIKVIGLSATPYRLGQGMITDEGIFDELCCDLTTVDEFNRLIAQGHISPLIAQPTNVEVDTSGIRIVNGDFAKGQSDEAADKVMYDALKETAEKGYNRHSWMVFTAGIKSANHAAEILNSFGVSAVAIHSKLPGKVNDQSFKDYKEGKIRAICGCNKFVTGFDHPPADLLADLNPTVSPGKHVQKLGRLTRPYDGSDPNFPNVKENGLVLDFAGNIRRLGPINDPRIPRKKGKGTGEVPIKICDACGTYNHASVRFCCNPDCEMEFKFQTKLVSSAHSDTPLRSDAPVIEFFNVDRIIYHRHEKTGMPPSMKVSYYSGVRRFTEYVCLQHSHPYARKRALDWWRQRHSIEAPETTDEALSYIAELRVPARIRVWVNKKYPEVMACEW